MGADAGPESWVARLRSGHRGTLARAITAVENDAPEAGGMIAAVQPYVGRARVVGVTGPPGAGKSTLVNAYVAELRRRGETVGVVAVDPSSPLTGGAILGDRIRMGEHASDRDVFVRSLAARGHLGGLTRAAASVVDLMDAAGKDVIVLETVGAGQSEVEVAELARTVVVVCPPGLGDEVQAIKAGILEIADVLVVTKCDLPAAERTARQLADRAAMRSGGWRVPVVRTIAPEAKGIAEMADAIARHAAQKTADGAGTGNSRVRRLVADLAAAELRRRIEANGGPALRDLLAAVTRGELSPHEAARRALALATDTQAGR